MRRKDEGAGPSPEAEARACEAGGAVVGRPYGRVQLVETGRKLFGKERQRVFLEYLAATCNVERSARAAGVSAQCVYARRMKDAAFREAWDRALEQGYARLEVRLVEAGGGAAPIEVAGDLVLPEEPLDRELGMHLLREHKKGLAGMARAPQPPLKGAEWQEVEAHFIARLKALKVRLSPSPDAPADGGGR